MLGCGPVGLAVIAALRLQGHRADRRRRLLGRTPRAGRRRWARTRSSTLARSRPSTPGGGSTAREAARHLRGGRRARHDRRGHAARAPQTPGSWSSACAWRPTPSSRCRGIAKELTVRFVLGYDPMEFAGTLRAIAEGELDVAPLITGRVGIDGVPQAFVDLADPDDARQDPRRRRCPPAVPSRSHRRGCVEADTCVTSRTRATGSRAARAAGRGRDGRRWSKPAVDGQRPATGGALGLADLDDQRAAGRQPRRAPRRRSARSPRARSARRPAPPPAPSRPPRGAALAGGDVGRVARRSRRPRRAARRAARRTSALRPAAPGAPAAAEAGEVGPGDSERVGRHVGGPHLDARRARRRATARSRPNPVPRSTATTPVARDARRAGDGLAPTTTSVSGRGISTRAVDEQVERAEPPAAEHVLQRLARQPPRDHRVEAAMASVGDRVVEVRDAARRPRSPTPPRRCQPGVAALAAPAPVGDLGQQRPPGRASPSRAVGRGGGPARPAPARRTPRRAHRPAPGRACRSSGRCGGR